MSRLDDIKEAYDNIQVPAELKERVDYELSVIEQMGFSAYFLITWDFIHYAKENGAWITTDEACAKHVLKQKGYDIEVHY